MKKNCNFSRSCKKCDTSECSPICYPYVFMYGITGEGGLWATRNVPKRYSNALLENLPIKNEQVYKRMIAYIKDVANIVLNKRVGLYLHGGTGNGKTTTAITILNEFVIARAKLHLNGSKKILFNPALFLKTSDFQNVYNAQFRGTPEMQMAASERYYKLKERMKEVELLVIDDIAMRDTTEAFKQELYEILDHRVTEELTTIFTSNVALENLVEFLGERISSRIEGMVFPFKFEGVDQRKGGLF